ncbi:MAG: hypothetical protein ACLQVI_16590 [Polyangiaceae bacterium]|jgi:hypothetical protein
MRAIAAAATFVLASSLLDPVRADGAPPTSHSVAAGSGEPAPTLRSQVFSPYEQAAIDGALAEKHEVIDPTPEGKLLEGIDIVTLDVIEPRDPAPGIINGLHVTTKHYIIDREILLRPGEHYKAVTVEESVRNLRSLPQLSVVIAIAVRGSGPGRVRLLVITKDVWSLRLAWDLNAVPQGIEDLIIQPSETNFLGTHQVAALYFEMDPATLSYGAGYHVPRLEGTRNVLDASVQLIFNRASGAAEGSTGEILADQPLFSAKTKWAWDSAMTWDQQIARRFVSAQESYYPATINGTTYQIPFEYFTRTYYAQESVTRSFGWDVKHDISLGGFVDLRTYRTTATQADDNPAALAQFAALNIPESVDRVGPFLQYHGYRTRFIRVLDFQTLGLQEDYRLGHEVYLRLYPMPKAFGSSSDQLGVYAAMNYTVALGDGIIRGTVESVTEGQANGLSQASIGGGGEIVTPRMGIGRFVYDFEVLSRYRNSLNLETFLGGDSRLRGYPSSYFVGSDYIVSNLEFRTRPVEILHALEVGADLFYDVGDAAFGFNNLHMYQGVGAGLRALFPQLDRDVFRLDFGFPVGNGANLPGVIPWTFFIAFQQAFTVPTLTAAALPSGAPSD